MHVRASVHVCMCMCVSVHKRVQCEAIQVCVYVCPSVCMCVHVCAHTCEWEPLSKDLTKKQGVEVDTGL